MIDKIRLSWYSDCENGRAVIICASVYCSDAVGCSQRDAMSTGSITGLNVQKLTEIE